MRAGVEEVLRDGAAVDTAVKVRAPKVANTSVAKSVDEPLRRGFARDLGEDFAPRRRTQGPVEARVREEDYVPPKRFDGLRFRLRGGVPRSIAGRVVAGSVAVALLAGVSFGLWELRTMLLTNPRLVLESSAAIQITGNSHLTRAQLLTVFGEDVERNILTVSLAERRTMLERLPWVEHATVMRLLPNRFRVAIVERKPVAFVRQGSRIGLVDKNGVLLDMASDGDAAGDAGAETHYSFPVVTGISAEEPLSVRASRMKMFVRFMAELGEKAKTVSEIDLSSPEDVKALIQDGSSEILVHFGEKDFLHRYELYEKNLPGWKSAYPKLASADMRYERQVVLEMQPGAGVTASEKGAEAKAAAGINKAEAKGAARVATAKPADSDGIKPTHVAAKPATSLPGRVPNLGQPTALATPPQVKKVAGMGSASAGARPAATGHLTQSFDVKARPRPTQVDPQ